VTDVRTVHLDSLDALRATAEAWDELWRRSDATLPSLRAELLAQWVEHFARPDDFHALAVEADGRLVAALPLVRRRIAGLFEAGTMPCNEWSASGDLLLDSGVERARVLDALAAAIREMPWPLLWLDEAALDAPRWRELQRVLVGAGMTVAEHPRWQVGQVAIDHDWPAYKARWSRKHRQRMAWSLRRLTARGKVRLAVYSQLAPGEVASAMRQCFEIEDRGWKGAAGTSILRTPGMAEFFVRQAECAARWDQLEVVLLQCGNRPVAFCYGLWAKGVFHSLKTGYDPEHARQRPGQLLRYCLLERFFAGPERQAIDFQGPMNEAHAAWLPERYTVGRLAVAPRSLSGRLAVRAYRDFWLRRKAL
jgi:CelD/BcsL family acetyltransferase involved in cellulose biosynthesis